MLETSDAKFLWFALLATVSIVLALASCSRNHPETGELARDPHTLSNPDAFHVRHLDLELEVDFDRRRLRGVATLEFERLRPGVPMRLDTRGLAIERVELLRGGDKAPQEVPFHLGAEDPILGRALEIDVPSGGGRVRISYSTGPGATALQWLEPRQTRDGRGPFLYTQSQSIHARSWIPLQDTPSVKITYSARVRVPAGLTALMSAEPVSQRAREGEFSFAMRQPVPSYLIALAVGQLEFAATGARTGVYAEPSVVREAAREFADTERMLSAAERLFGPYRWERYDILVLPPSFPYGGMENARLTFATPTVIVGDRSLVALVAHEMAHSWSGNLVTNATWNDFWLNEGFTVYLEQRIVEELYGPERAAMEAVIGYEQLLREMERLPPADQKLKLSLEGRDPDEGVTAVPYEKGALFLKTLEVTCGRERFDRFLRGYFADFAFRSLTTEQFLDYLKQRLLDDLERQGKQVPVQQWVYQPGIPAGAWKPRSVALERVADQAQQWVAGRVPTSSLPARQWSTWEWLHFLRRLEGQVSSARMAELDRAFGLTSTPNAEIACQWLKLAIQARYEPAWPRLREFLHSVGRMKFLKPLYEELARTPEGKKWALEIFQQARPAYHPIAVTAIEKILSRD